MNTNEVAVIVGRFQVPQPTEAHLELFTHAIKKCSTVIVFVGHSPILNRLNIIPNQVIRNIISNTCAKINQENGNRTKIIVSSIQDVFNPPLWSMLLDKKIQELCNMNAVSTNNVVGIGGRDSFIDSYCGKLLKIARFHSNLGEVISASKVREAIYKNGPSEDPKFLEGMIYQRLLQYPTAYQTVDAVIRFDGAFLLGHRKGITKYRFIGGFSDPNSESLEEDAIRETYEETHLITSHAKYLGSTKIDDARYKNSGDSIKTALFQVIAEEYGTATFEEPEEENGFDDMPFIRWFKPEDINENMLVKEHVKLFNILKTQKII